MSDEPESTGESASAEDQRSVLFAQLILQQTNMAMMLLGKMAHPESGQVYKDLEGARLFIDQLEMLEAKTKGNLAKEESALLKQSLMNLRLAYVEAVESPQAERQTSSQPSPGAMGAATPSGGPSTNEPAPAGAEDEHRKKFSKKY